MLVVIDMINGFVKEGALADTHIARIIPKIIERIKFAQQTDEMVVFFKDCHSENDIEFLKYPRHCVKGSNECELIDELKPFEKCHNTILINKSTTNGFNEAKFRFLLGLENYNNTPCSIEVAGCCSDICVYDFATSLLDHANKTKSAIQVLIKEDCIDTFNSESHNADEVNQKVLDTLEGKGAHIILADETTEEINI